MPLSHSVLTPRASSQPIMIISQSDARTLSLAFARSALSSSCVVSFLFPMLHSSLQDHETADESSQNGTNHGESLVVNANSGSGALGGAAATALGRGTG